MRDRESRPAGLVTVSAMFSSEPSQNVRCELRQRVVTRAHHYDAVTRTGGCNQPVAAGGAISKDMGVASARFNAAYDVNRRDAAVCGAAEIDRLGLQKLVLGPQMPRECVDKLVLHQSLRAEAMRLEHDLQSTVEVV